MPILTSTDQAQAAELAPWDQFSEDIRGIWAAHETAMRPVRARYEQAIADAAATLTQRTNLANADYQAAVTEAWEALSAETDSLSRERDHQADQARTRYLAASAKIRHDMTPEAGSDGQAAD